MKVKKNKRDMNKRAYIKGYQVGLSGIGKDACPHQTTNTRESWMSGWREGRTANKDGFVGVSGVHKLPELQQRYAK